MFDSLTPAARNIAGIVQASDHQLPQKKHNRFKMMDPSMKQSPVTHEDEED